MLRENLTPVKEKELQRLLLIYGNSGIKSTEGNHVLIHDILDGEVGSDIIERISVNVDFHKDVTPECLGVVMKLLWDSSIF